MVFDCDDKDNCFSIENTKFFANYVSSVIICVSRIFSGNGVNRKEDPQRPN